VVVGAVRNSRGKRAALLALSTVTASEEKIIRCLGVEATRALIAGRFAQTRPKRSIREQLEIVGKILQTLDVKLCSQINIDRI